MSYIHTIPLLAAVAGNNRDGTTAIYRRFNCLAARNLLLLQSELAGLEHKLDIFDKEDQENQEGLQSLRSWEGYRVRNGEDSERMRLVMQIRSTMREFREALLFESTLASLPPPDSKSLEAAHRHIRRREQDQTTVPILEGRGPYIYDDQEDMVAVKGSEPRDRLTSFVRDHMGFLFKEHATDDRYFHTGYASVQTIAKFISYLSTILAALLLVGAILALYTIRSNDLKLGLIALFTTLFAASVGLFTNAKRAEIFGATAAYAAVLVVFVSGDLGAK